VLSSAASDVRVECDYCRSTVVAVGDDGTAVAVVERFTAIENRMPGATDIRALPYGNAESILSLEPFSVLLDSKGALPGPRVTRYGVDRFGGLLVDCGVPSYDIAAGVTPLRQIPAYDVSSAASRDVDDAPRYGDEAVGGTFLTQSIRSQTNAAFAAVGTERAFNASGEDGKFSYNAASSGDYADRRARADASVTAPALGGSFSANAILAANQYDGDEYGAQDGSFSALRLNFSRAGALSPYADAVVDRAGYTALSSSASAIWGGWSDAALQAGIRTSARISTFADAGARLSTGYYTTTSYGIPRVAGSTGQTHVFAGAESHDSRARWRAEIGAFGFKYNGGRLSVPVPKSANAIASSLSLAYDLAPQWNIELAQTSSFRLPTLIETYTYGDTAALTYDRYQTANATLTYGDRRRLRAGFTVVRANVSGLDSGSITSAGAFASWQLAPNISLRAWTLHFSDTTHATMPVYRYGGIPQPATPSSAWIAYRNGSGVTADILWRRDLLDYKSDEHLDASLGGPLARGLRWFAATERRQGQRFSALGLRFEP
jgi:hypothetical protein